MFVEYATEKAAQWHLPQGVVGTPVVAQSGHRLLGAAVAWLCAHVLTAAAVLSVGPAAFLLWIAISLALPHGDVLPGVHVGGIPVGGQNPEAAAELVEAHATTFADRPVTLSVNGTAWTASLEELGLSPDPDRSLKAAMAFGRDHDRVEGVLHAVNVSDTPIYLPLVVALDAHRLHTYLDRIDEERGSPAINASVTIDGTTVTVAPAGEGQVLDRAAIRATITEQIRMLEPITVTTTMVTQQPTISTQEAGRAQRVAQAAIDAPLTLTLAEETWSLAPEEMAALIEVVPDAGEPSTLSVQLNADSVGVVVAQLADEIDAVPEDAWVQDLGTHSWLVPSKTGRTVEQDHLAAAIHEALTRSRPTVTVPVTDEREPTVTTQDLMHELGMTGIVGVGNSYYAGSGAGRAHNVEQAA